MSNHLSPSGQSDHYSVGSGASPASSQRSTNAGTMSTSASSIHSDTEADSPANGPKPTPCQWEGCQLTYDDPEELYRHLCDDHVGRKSTNNLCLTCRWIGCDVTCAKRDHITSHLRVHTPLKPHSCDTCGKTFKRPQDLKKHERIHTEAHQLAQQQRAKGIMPGMPGSAYGPNMHDAGAYTAFNLAASHGAVPGMNIAHVQQPPYGYAYPAAAQHQQSPRFGLPPPPTATSAYPALPGAVPAAAPAGYPSMYGPGSHAPQHHREQTPQWSGAASNASVSPMSSHLGTPGPRSGNYHAAPPSQYVSSFTPLQQTHAAEMKPDSYIHYAAGERPKPADDMSSYLGLARGASYSTAGHKRSWDESVEATRGFVNDVQSKQMRPTYDQGMAQRLEHTFAGGIDEASLSALLQNIDPASMHSSHVDGPALSSLLAGQAPSFNASSKKTDLAELNAFLLQLGAHAAKDLIANNAAATQHASAPPMHHHHHQQSHSAGSSSSSAPSQEMHNPFDVNNLQAYGLADIPGFDESLFEYESVAPQQQQHASSQWAGQRPIAQLPARSSYANEVSASLYTNAAPYRHAHGHALVPQLAAKDGSSANYRRVEALTRAAPVETASGVHDVHLRDSKDTSRDMDVDEAPSHDRASSNRSASPAASEATSEASTVSIHRPSSSSSSAQRHGLYPRLSPVDGARTSSNAPASPTSPYTNAPFRPRPMPYDRQARSQRSTTSDAGSPSPPPSVSSEPRRTPQRSSTVDAVADDVAALNGLGASPTEEGVPLAVRAQHVRLIRDLLLAINYPGRRAQGDSPPAKLAPLRLSTSNASLSASAAANAHEQQADSSLARVRALSGSAEEDGDRTPIARNAPPQPLKDEGRSLPAIAELLRSIPAAAPPTGPGGRRLMDVDV